MDFADDPEFPRMVEFINAGYDVLVTRTFSKLHGLASLRVGYGFGRGDLMEKVRQQKLHLTVVVWLIWGPQPQLMMRSLFLLV